MDEFSTDCPCGRGVLTFRTASGFALRAHCPVCDRGYWYRHDAASAELRDAILPKPRPDGYTPVAAYLDTYWTDDVPGLTPDAFVVQNGLFLLAARRLDTAHRLFEHGRAVIAEAAKHGARDDLIHEAFGDIELGVVALHRAIVTCLEIDKRWHQENCSLPDIVSDALAKITALRNSVEHADERVLGFVRPRVKGPQARSLSLNFMSLFMRDVVLEYLKAQFPDDSSRWHPTRDGAPLRRESMYHDQRIDIDDEVTSLMVANREWLLATWRSLRALG